MSTPVGAAATAEMAANAAALTPATHTNPEDTAASKSPACPTYGAGTVGMVLGKFAPLHNGHVYMMQLATQETERVVVVIYDAPGVTDVPLCVRGQWIRSLFPRADVRLAWDGPQVSGYTPEIKKMHEDYLLALLADVKITHFYSSEPYGEHVSAALGAVDRRVDPERVTVPISATMVRADTYGVRRLVPDIVYRDLIVNVVFVGAPSTGKSSIADRMAREYDTACMPEYGREYWEKHNIDRRLTPEQLVEIARGHFEREQEMLLQARTYLFTDTNAITTFMFGIAYHDKVLPELADWARRAEKRYDLTFLCGDDIPYADTWDRSGDADRHKFQKQIRADLLERRIPFFELVGDIETRVQTVKSVLARFRKWRSFAEMVALK